MTVFLAVALLLLSFALDCWVDVVIGWLFLKFRAVLGLMIVFRR